MFQQLIEVINELHKLQAKIDALTRKVEAMYNSIYGDGDGGDTHVDME